MDASNLLRMIRLQNIFAPGPDSGGISENGPIVAGNDMPSQGGIMGNLPQTLNQVEQQQPYSGMNPQQQQGPHPIDYGMQPQQPNQYMDTPADPNQMQGQPINSPYQHQNIDQLNRMIADYPVEKPASKWRHVGAMLVGAGYGPEAADKFLSDPYNKQVVAWKNKVGPVENAATQERIGNQNQRQFDIQNQKLGETERKNKENEDVAREKLKIQADRAAVYRYSREHPDHKFQTNDKGQIVALDPKGGSGFIVTDENGEPIKSDRLSPEDRQNLQLDLIKARTSGQIQVEGAKQTNRETNIQSQETNRQADIAARGKEARTTKSTAGTTTGASKPELPTQTKVRQYIKAREAYNNHPEWQKYITLGKPGTNDFTLKPPSKGFFSDFGSDDEYKNLVNFIGTNVSPVPSHGNTPKILSITPVK